MVSFLNSIKVTSILNNLRIKKSRSVLLFFFVFSNVCQAYIPPSGIIFEKLTDNHGSGNYVINLELTFSNATESVVIKENWAVENELSMRLLATKDKSPGSDFKIYRLYKDGNFQFKEIQQRSNRRISEEFFQPLFWSRNVQYVIQQLKLNQILQSNYVLPSPKQKSPTEFLYPQEDFLRLSRTGGVVNYAFGYPIASEDEFSYPGLWVEQDAFVIRKLRSKFKYEVQANNFVEYSRGFYFPKEMIINWNGSTVHIKTTSISARGKFAKSVMAQDQIESTMVNLENSSLKDVIEDFYKRFR